MEEEIKSTVDYIMLICKDPLYKSVPADALRAQIEERIRMAGAEILRSGATRLQIAAGALTSKRTA